MAARTDLFDLGRLRLTAGEARRFPVSVPVEPFGFGGQVYGVEPAEVPATLDVSRMTGQGYSLRLRFAATLAGACMRCLAPAQPEFIVDAREIDQPGGGEELDSPYVDDEQLDLHAWTRDALSLALPAQIVCRADCAGLCPQCGANLNDDPDHAHEREPDPRWAKLRELNLGEGQG
jgi:uncharacterized protein